MTGWELMDLPVARGWRDDVFAPSVESLQLHDATAEPNVGIFYVNAKGMAVNRSYLLCCAHCERLQSVGLERLPPNQTVAYYQQCLVQLFHLVVVGSDPYIEAHVEHATTVPKMKVPKNMSRLMMLHMAVMTTSCCLIVKLLRAILARISMRVMIW